MARKLPHIHETSPVGIAVFNMAWAEPLMISSVMLKSVAHRRLTGADSRVKISQALRIQHRKKKLGPRSARKPSLMPPGVLIRQ